MEAVAPELFSLGHRPSWHNRAGHVDRSACVVIRASQLRHRAALQAAPTAPRAGPNALKRGKPQARTAREARGTVTVTADDLNLVLYRSLPRRVSGDWRTGKANALKQHEPDPHLQALARQRLHGPGLDQGLPANPNAGAARSKILGLPPDWRQTLTLERWRQHERLAQHFLICPRCAGKAARLYLVLCTEREFQDAAIALVWLRTYEPQRILHPDFRPIGQRLLQRYSLLLPPRTLLCRHCLGLRYGQIKRRE